MDGISAPAKILTTIALLGLIAVFWFWDAGQYAHGKVMDITHKSYLPATCSFTGNRVNDVLQNAQVYFFNGKIRMDMRSSTYEKKIVAHELVRNTLGAYVWRDDSPAGQISQETLSFEQLMKSSPNADWFCFPWLFVNTSLFELPKGVTFRNT